MQVSGAGLFPSVVVAGVLGDEATQDFFPWKLRLKDFVDCALHGLRQLPLHSRGGHGLRDLYLGVLHLLRFRKVTGLGFVVPHFAKGWLLVALSRLVLLQSGIDRFRFQVLILMVDERAIGQQHPGFVDHRIDRIIASDVPELMLAALSAEGVQHGDVHHLMTDERFGLRQGQPVDEFRIVSQHDRVGVGGLAGGILYELQMERDACEKGRAQNQTRPCLDQLFSWVHEASRRGA